MQLEGGKYHAETHSQPEMQGVGLVSCVPRAAILQSQQRDEFSPHLQHLGAYTRQAD